MLTLNYTCENKEVLLNIINLCIDSNISFEFMNNNELYFAIYDDLDFEFKQSILGIEVINHFNKV